MKFLKEFLPRKIIRKIRHFRRLRVRLDAIEKNEANFLKQKYNGIDETQINSHEFSIYSQNGEDGIIAYIFSKIGIKNASFVEFGSGGERGCNSSNLAINHGWKGLFIDCIKRNVLDGRDYYSAFPLVKFAHNWITKENINHIIKENGFCGEVDLLSIDIDGNDYHIFNVLEVIKPRVVIIEYNALLGNKSSIVTKYNSEGLSTRGASLKALTTLANKKGYILVGCVSVGSNAFYIRKDVAEGKIKKVGINDVFFKKNTYSL